MKRMILICIGIALALSLQSVLAITTDIADSYLSKQTVVTEIRGNILGPIESGNVELRRGHVLVPIDFEIRKLGDSYFLWFITPEGEENYTLNIKDIPSTVSGQMEDVTYTKNFSVSANLSAYTIKPGFVYAMSDFEIGMQLNEDDDREISFLFLEEENSSAVLKPGENTITFSIKKANESGIYNLTIEDYNLPIFIKVNKTVQIHNVFVNESQNLTNENASRLIENISAEINISDNESNVIDAERAKYHCYEFPGKICEASQTCSGKTITSSDGACCVNGDCSSQESGGSYSWVGYLLGAIVIIGGIFFYLKYKKTKEEQNPLAKKVGEIERRMH